MSHDLLPLRPRDTLADARARKAAKRRERKDRDYLAWIHTLRCLVPACPAPVSAHHEPPRSHGAEACDRRTVPLCQSHHQGFLGRHNLGKEDFEALCGLDLDAAVARLQQEYDNR